MSFREASIEITKTISKETKQSNGIFFTPKEARDVVFDILRKHVKSPKSILEPSFGSGEFLEDAYEVFPEAVVTGVELNRELFALSKRPNLFNVDFLQYSGKHDLIIGNPPYFVIEKSKDTELCQSGRPNIFIQFLYKAITQNLNQMGVLAFVLPTSFYNCLYYEKMRKWIYENTTVLHAEALTGSYLDTQQDTFVLVVKNALPTGIQKFFFNKTYITPFYKELAELVVNTSTMAELGYEVKTGEVVWNQEKDKLTDSGTLLIYSSNFVSGTLVLDNLKLPKKQYIRGFKKQPRSGKAILINRGYGNAEYVLKPILIDQPSFYCENHVNVIRATEKANISIEKILQSLLDPRTSLFIRYFVGNNALSKSEIEKCLPIWVCAT